MTAYEKALADLDASRAELVALKPALDFLEQVRDDLYPDENPKYGRCLVRYNHGEAWIHLRTGDIREIVPIIRRIRAAGHPLQYHYDVEDNGWRCYKMGKILAIADIVSKGGVCRMEIVGTKEVPVYKIVCDDGAEVDDLPVELHSFDAEVPA